ncbi:hypothetical protein IQ64_35810 [Streptomyces stelliscabiei]|nr:hypothetical protein IQ64_35810 [Streptomyces stelliscabiei]
MGPPATPTAVAHAERIRASTEGRPAEQAGTGGGQSTAERIAARILPGYRADEALRQQARLGELRARGVIAAEDEPVDEDEEYDEEVLVDEEEGDEVPVTTAELYARRERERQQAEHAATLAAHRSVGQAAAPSQVHQYTERVAQQYRRTTPWPTAS